MGTEEIINEGKEDLLPAGTVRIAETVYPTLQEIIDTKIIIKADVKDNITKVVIEETIDHPTAGRLTKQNILTFDGQKMTNKEFYVPEKSELLEALKKATPEEITQIKELLR
jgi:hypothetical protein